MSGVIELIARAANDYGGVCKRTSHRTALLDFPVRFVDGSTRLHYLLLNIDGNRVWVKEHSPEHLPAFCPERHINPDGTFCLSYREVDNLDVIDYLSAVKWLDTVHKYLMLQRRAERLRKWPNNNVWAHGDAAKHEVRALRAAAALGPLIKTALLSGALSLQRRKSKRRPILDVWNGGLLLFSVWEKHKRVINRKRECFCRSNWPRRSKKLRRCKDHASQAVELALAMRDWSDAEEDFWKLVKGYECCGTCDGCPLSIEAHPEIQSLA